MAEVSHRRRVANHPRSSRITQPCRAGSQEISKHLENATVSPPVISENLKSHQNQLTIPPPLSDKVREEDCGEFH